MTNTFDEMMESLLFATFNSKRLKEFPRCRATFEWWIIRNKYGEELPMSAQGPFEVEVFFDDRRGVKLGKWVAQVLPTKQRLAAKHKTYKDCCDYVNAEFRKQVKGWTIVNE